MEPLSLVETVVQEAQRGDGWVKLVGDWISRDSGDLAPSFPAEDFAAAIAAAHEHGAKVTAHCFGEAVLPNLIDAGHRLHRARHRAVDRPGRDDGRARHRAGPTVMQIDKFPQYADAGRDRFPRYADHMTDLHARDSETRSWPPTSSGSPLYAGSDGGGVSRHGNIAGEVIAMHELGMPADYALGAASLAGPRVARLERHPGRGRPGRLRGLPA